MRFSKSTMRMSGALAAACALIACALAGCADTGRYVKSRWQLVRPDHPCADTRLVIYFDEGSDRLSQPARQLIVETGRIYRHCVVGRVQVIGLADSTGAPEVNWTLSQRRARRVAEALVEQHLPAPSFDVSAVGDQGATRPDGREDPMRRRAEVVLTMKR